MWSEIREEVFAGSNRYLLYGVLLYTKKDVHIVKLLKDQDYCAALDELTGERLLLFVASLFPGEYKVQAAPNNAFSYLAPVWREPGANLELLSWFDLYDSKSLPCLGLFQLTEEAFRHRIVRLSADSVDGAFVSLKDWLQPITERLADGDATRRAAIFEDVGWTVTTIEWRQKVKQLIGAITLLRGAAGL